MLLQVKRFTLLIVGGLLSFIHLSAVSAQAVSEEFVKLEKKVDDISYLQRQRTWELIGEMYALARQSPDSSLLIAHCLQSETLFRLRQGMVDSTLTERINKRLNKEDISPKEQSLLLTSLMRSHLMAGEYTEIFDVSLKIIDIAKENNDSMLLVQTYNTMGVTYANFFLNDMAEEYFNEALRWITPSAYPSEYYSIKNNLFHNYNFNPDAHKNIAIKDSLYTLVNHAKAEGKDNLLPFLYSNLGDYLSSVHDDSAHYFLLKSLELCEDNPHMQVITLLNLGNNYKAKGDLKEALHYYKKAETTENNNNLRLLSSTYRNISAVYEELGTIDEALKYARLAQVLDDKIHRNHLLVEAYRKYLSATVAITENKLKWAQSEIEVRNKQFTIILLSLTLFIIIIIFLLFMMRQTRKNTKQRILLKEMENKELTTRLELEKELKKAQDEQLENKLREITSYSLLLSNKNNVLNNILSISERLSPSEKTIKKEIRNAIKGNLHVEEDWDNFMLHFNDVHPSFFDKLKESCPDITQLELKLAAYIKIGLSTNQIAQMLNITPNSIWVNRSRMKKKMGLAKDENMDNVIQAL